jgi:hypothetical protein
VPNNLELTGKAETFTIQVRYDTLDLYGKITARRTFTVSRE